MKFRRFTSAGIVAVRDFLAKCMLLSCVAFAGTAWAESVDITVRHAPYVVSSVTKKTEKAWAVCKFCGSKTSYERTFKWDTNDRVWIETTKSDDIPTVCRKCQSLVRDQEKIDRKERKLDAKIEYQRSRLRVKEKERDLRELRNRAR